MSQRRSPYRWWDDGKTVEYTPCYFCGVEATYFHIHASLDQKVWSCATHRCNECIKL